MMQLSVQPRPFWKMPSLWEDDEENTFTNWASTSGVSISEDEKHVYVEAHVPGVNQDDVDITFDKGTLWIKAESKEEDGDKKKKYYRQATSSFSYRIAVPGEIDLSIEPEADYKNGVMKVTFTKSPHSQPKKISVKTQK